MVGLEWGLLGPDSLEVKRRARTLGLGPAVRFFNERAVPGIGGVWYAKQLLFPILGIALATRLKAEGQNFSNITCANAIEALACWLGLDSNNWQGDSRLRGAVKLRNAKDLSFKSVSKANFYVTQPMRMSTVTALPALGLVQHDAKRFNQYQLSKQCLHKFAFINNASGIYGNEALEYLYKWSKDNREVLSGRFKSALCEVLSPIATPDKKLLNLIMDILISGGEEEESVNKQRRRNALQWVEKLRQSNEDYTDWDSRPSMIDKEHWHDLKTGAAFFALRFKSLEVLNKLESHMLTLKDSRAFDLKKVGLPQSVLSRIKELKKLASYYLSLNHNESVSLKFAKECNLEELTEIVRHLVERDNRVLRLMGSTVIPGPAFNSFVNESLTGIESDDEDVEPISKRLPHNISRRISNLFYLNSDLYGELDLWLGKKISSDDEELA